MAEAAEGGNPIPYEMKIRSQFDKKLREVKIFMIHHENIFHPVFIHF